MPLRSPGLCSQLAGVEAGYACFCGSESDLARGRPAPATDCDQICFGHPGQLCGGDGRLGIYEGGAWVRGVVWVGSGVQCSARRVEMWEAAGCGQGLRRGLGRRQGPKRELG